MVITKPTVKRPGLSKPVQIAGLPRPSQITKTHKQAIQYQKVYHLNPENLATYEAMTYPSLQARWQTQPQRGELLGVSASVAGEMVGFAVAELGVQSAREADSEPAAELLSLFVLPEYRQQGIGTALDKHLQQLIAQPLAH
jgi:GNAT superfamily N-acetyltransferase